MTYIRLSKLSPALKADLLPIIVQMNLTADKQWARLSVNASPEKTVRNPFPIYSSRLRSGPVVWRVGFIWKPSVYDDDRVCPVTDGNTEPKNKTQRADW